MSNYIALVSFASNLCTMGAGETRSLDDKNSEVQALVNAGYITKAGGGLFGANDTDEETKTKPKKTTTKKTTKKVSDKNEND